MFKIENKQIHITRGDIGCLNISAKNEDGTDYEFQVGDIVRFTVYKKKDCNSVQLMKDVAVETISTNVEVNLTSDDTKIGDVINIPTDYWYEVELNPETKPQTIIGYDVDGPKLFTLYPEASGK